MHQLLQRQLRMARATDGPLDIDALLKLVSKAYEDGDTSRQRLERSMEVASAEVRELYDQSIKEKEAADRANLSKSQFLATMSHEIRTPMNGVLGFARVLLDSGLTEDQQDAAQIILNCGESLLTILNDILDLSKIEAGALELEAIDFEIEHIVENCVELFKAQASSKHIELATFVDPCIPRRLRGDPGRIAQVLNNLVGNAIKFTEAGTVGIEAVLLQSRQAGTHRLAFTITDPGIGIAADKLDYIFESFTQADASNARQFGGSGLGLAICKRLAHAFEGDITVSSTFGAGSIFTFELSLRDAEPPSKTILEDVAPAYLQGRHLLVVDDNEVNRRLSQAQLNAFGMSCVVAVDAADAMRIINEQRGSGKSFDLAIIDHMLPNEDGISLGRRIHSTEGFEALPLILSSSAALASRRQALELGFAAVVHKPVRQSVLIPAIRDCLTATERTNAEEINDAAPPTPPGSVARVRLLVAEDNAINQKLVMHMLTKAGYLVDMVGNGAEAVQAARTLNYDVILMDIQMPEMDGEAATAAIRNLNSVVASIPIIALTASAMKGDHEHYLSIGMDDYASKPINFDLLIEKIRVWTTVRRQNIETGRGLI